MTPKCRHFRMGGVCGILTNTTCKGWDKKCCFRVTEKDFIARRDEAILLCRKRNLCKDCRYVYGEPCKTSKE